jgi:Cdc6-like AAA superfamily ATPase
MINETNETLIDQINKRRAERSSQFGGYKLLCNPFTPYKPETAVKSLANRKEERAQFVDSFLKLTEGEINHVFITGKRGIGKSHLLRYFFDEVSKSHSEMGIPEPLFFGDPNDCNRWLAEKFKDLKEPVYIFLDDAYFVRLPFYFPDTTNPLYKNKLIKTVSCWQESIIIDMPQIEPSSITEDFDEIRLTSLKENDEIEVLKKRITVSCEQKDLEYCLSLFDNSFFIELTKVSHGNPRLLLKNASAIFTENAQVGRKKFTGTNVIEYTLKHDIKTTKQIEETFEKLTPPQKRVLYAISAVSLMQKSIECSLKEIAQVLDVSRPAVINSLVPLQESRIIEFRSSERGRTRLYRISEEYRDFFAERYKDEIKRVIYAIDSKNKEV